MDRFPYPPRTLNCVSMRHDLPDVYDDRPLRPPRPPRTWPMIVVVVVLIAAGAAAFWYFRQTRPEPAELRANTAPVRVVGDRPGGARRIAGAAINEAEATLLLRRALARSVRGDCLAIMSRGAAGNAYLFTAFNSCDRTRLGQWKVDGKTRAVSRK